MEESGVGVHESLLDFSFGLDDSTFSDRSLLLQIADEAAGADKPREKTIHVNSLILGARSQFFRKLFSNGMRESGQKLVTLKIENSEEDSLMNLLKYAYNNNLPTTLDALLSLLIIADKFEVTSCLRDCTRLLQSMPMTCESASLYLDLPPNFQPLTDEAKEFLVAHFNDFDKCKEELLDLSLAGILVVLSSDDLQVTSEDVVYDSVLKWVLKHYPDLEERRRILKTHLLDLVRFPFMSKPQLTEKVLTCTDIDRELASHIVFRAILFKADTSLRQRSQQQFVERAYKYRHFTVVKFESTRQHCLAYFHLTKKELSRIFPNGEIMSETFHFGKQELALICKCYKRKKKYYFRLAIKVVALVAPFTFEYEMAVRMKPLKKEFKTWMSGTLKLTKSGSIKNVYDTYWTNITADDSKVLINDTLHMRVSLTIKNDTTNGNS